MCCMGGGSHDILFTVSLEKAQRKKGAWDGDILFSTMYRYPKHNHAHLHSIHMSCAYVRHTFDTIPRAKNGTYLQRIMPPHVKRPKKIVHLDAS